MYSKLLPLPHGCHDGQVLLSGLQRASPRLRRHLHALHVQRHLCGGRYANVRTEVQVHAKCKSEDEKAAQPWTCQRPYQMNTSARPRFNGVLITEVILDWKICRPIMASIASTLAPRSCAARSRGYQALGATLSTG